MVGFEVEEINENLNTFDAYSSIISEGVIFRIMKISRHSKAFIK